jgi:hypothetical protein
MSSILSLTLADDYGRTTKRLIEMADFATIAEYVTAAAAFVAELNDATELGLVRVDLIRQAITTGFAVEVGANVDVGGTVSGYIVDGNGKKASLKIPHVKPGFVNPDGTLDLTAADLAAYLALFEDAADFFLSDGEQIETWIKGTLYR